MKGHFIMKEKNFLARALICTLALFIFCGGFCLAFAPAPAFSEAENRYLAKFPPFDFHAVTHGDFAKGLSLYAAERFPLRHALRGGYAIAELCLGKREIGDVVICRDGSLTRRHPVDMATFEKNLTAANALTRGATEVGKPALFLPIPRRIDVAGNILPRLYPTSEGGALYDALATLTTAPDLRHLDAALWYRTDHHLNADGARQIYLSICDALSLVPYPANFFEKETVSENFLGTTAKAAGIPSLTPDSITLWRYEEEKTLVIKKDGKDALLDGCYDLEKLNTADQYAVYFGGNCGVLEISKGDADTRPILLVVRDSFAGAVLPFLALHYRIRAVDPRYTAVNLEEELQAADALLVLCGISTLSGAPFVLQST